MILISEGCNHLGKAGYKFIHACLCWLLSFYLYQWFYMQIEKQHSADDVTSILILSSGLAWAKRVILKMKNARNLDANNIDTHFVQSIRHNKDTTSFMHKFLCWSSIWVKACNHSKAPKFSQKLFQVHGKMTLTQPAYWHMKSILLVHFFLT